MTKPKVLFTDGEGPIVFKDLAADIMGRTTFVHNDIKISGSDFYTVLSFYDDYLAEIGIEDYQAGDTLALIVPHLITHKITDEDIAEEAKDAKVCLGVEEYIAGLKRDGWEIRIISTAYSQMWELVGQHIGIPMEQIACTRLSLTKLRQQFGSEEFHRKTQLFENTLLSLLPLAKEAIREVDEGTSVIDVLRRNPRFEPLLNLLDEFYWESLPRIGYRPLEMVRVIGGRRKIEAAERFADELRVNLSDVVYVGDSITDDALHARLLQEGGLPIAINGNRYALRNARISIATQDMRAVRPILDTWHKGGFEEVRHFVTKNGEVSLTPRKELSGIVDAERPRYHLINPIDQQDFQEILSVHKEFRRLVRGKAAKLG